MNNSDNRLPEETLEVLVRSFFRESSGYGFSQIDYIRFVNMLLDFSMQTKNQSDSTADSNQKTEFREKGFMQLPITGKKTKIRKYNPDDNTLMEQWLGDDYGRQFLLSRTTAQIIGLNRITKDDWNIFGIVTTLENVPIGCVAYLGYNVDQRKAELRKMIGEPSMRGKGYAKEATQLWVNYGVAALKIKKIFLSTLNTDIRNIRLNESLGFKVEGILRNEICLNGTYQDVLRMGYWSENGGNCGL